MNDRVTKNGWAVFAILVACAPIAGCGQLRLPAIDPSGNRIFLPPPNSTRLAGASRNGGLLPSPVFSTPDAPPPCESSIAADSQVFPVSTIAPGGASSIVVSQGNVVAPVGSEVILLAGLRQADGNLATGQPLQWTISQESAGHFVEVGDGGRGPVDRMLRRKSPQLTNKLASGTTVLRQEMMTRGTPSPNDDVIVQPGQGWVRLASPTAGTTVVTITAPEAAGWE